MYKSVLTLLMLALLTCCSAGCKSMKEIKVVPESLQSSVQNLRGKKNTSEFQDPVRMAAIWSEGVYSQLGSPPVRGFGARLFFYNDVGETIKVDGGLIVYGYDDSKFKEDLSADRKFVFEQSKFQTHYSESDLGDSYSVWIPWDKVGGEERTVSLIPIFKSVNGIVLKGGQTASVLTGPKYKDSDSESTAQPNNSISKLPSHVRTADYAAASTTDANISTAAFSESANPDSPMTAEGESTRGKSNATTIYLPRSMTRRLQSLPPQNPFTRETKQPNQRTSEESNAAKVESSTPGSELYRSLPMNTSFKEPPRVFGLPGSH